MLLAKGFVLAGSKHRTERSTACRHCPGCSCPAAAQRDRSHLRVEGDDGGSSAVPPSWTSKSRARSSCPSPLLRWAQTCPASLLAAAGSPQLASRHHLQTASSIFTGATSCDTSTTFWSKARP